MLVLKILAILLGFLEKLLSRAEAALNFVMKAGDELMKKLRHREEWRLHPELSYIFDMQGLF